VTAPQQPPPGGEPAEVSRDPEGLGRHYRPLLDPLASDADMARAAADWALKDFRWAGGLGWRWYSPETGAWTPAPDEAVIEQVRRFLLAMAAACLKLAAGQTGNGKDGKFYEGLSETWRKQATAKRINAVARLARGICYTSPALFDAHPDLLNCPNGVAVLRTGELLEHSPEYLFTQVAGADWVPGARHPDIDKALEAIPADVRAYAQLRYGQAITGHKPPDDAISVQYGPGENGKTTVMLAIQRACGDYCAVLPPHLLLADPRAHTTDLMTLRGARCGIIEELPEERVLSVTRIKIASAPVITARHVHKDNVTFGNGCSLFISTNYRPQVRETDHGTWRRLEGLVPYPYTFRKSHERLRDEADRHGDATLRQRIAADQGERAAAMLAWLGTGAWRWYQGEAGREPRTMGQPPERVTGELAEWRESCDLLHGWFGEAVEWVAGCHVLSTDALAAFNEWARARGHERWGAELFAARLEAHAEVREHGVTKKRGVRRGSELGPPSRPSWMNLEPLPGSYAVWLGMRFRDLKNDVSAGGVECVGREQTQGYSGSGGRIYDQADTLDTRQIQGHPEPNWEAIWAMADKNQE
jgi:putative DNA primase/helicase